MPRFRDALAGPGLAAIAEIKRRSPSAGDLRPDADPARLTAGFERAGAAAISVLVDERFAGSWDDLRAAHQATSVPLLAKGFFSSADDLRTARDAGAEAVLLLLRDLDDATSARLLAEAESLGLDALVEAHDAEELERAVALDAPVVGINARDLTTFEIDRQRQLALMQARDPQGKLRELLSRPLVKVCGLTRQEDVDVAVEAGADLLGFILVERSPRRSESVLDVPETALSVAVFVEETPDTTADLVQLYPDDGGDVRGREALLLRDGVPVARVLDQPWQGHDSTHWSSAARVEGRVMLAGGLGPENVREAIAAVRPWAVDASSSLERAPGVKDHEKVRAWVAAARS